MSFTINPEFSTTETIVAETELYTIVVSRNQFALEASFRITHTVTDKHAFAGDLDITNTSSFFFEINPELPMYLIVNFGDETLQFKEEEYGIVIDAFDKDGQPIQEYGYTMNEDFEDEEDFDGPDEFEKGKLV